MAETYDRGLRGLIGDFIGGAVTDNPGFGAGIQHSYVQDQQQQRQLEINQRVAALNSHLAIQQARAQQENDAYTRASHPIGLVLQELNQRIAMNQKSLAEADRKAAAYQKMQDSGFMDLMMQSMTNDLRRSLGLTALNPDGSEAAPEADQNVKQDTVREALFGARMDPRVPAALQGLDIPETTDPLAQLANETLRRRGRPALYQTPHSGLPALSPTYGPQDSTNATDIFRMMSGAGGAPYGQPADVRDPQAQAAIDAHIEALLNARSRVPTHLSDIMDQLPAIRANPRGLVGFLEAARTR